MTDSITITGLVATEPRHIVTNEGLTISSFRLASAQRRFDRTQEKWIDVDTNWYTITAFRQLGVNCAGSIKKGDRVVVSGRLRIREWENGERTGTTVDIEADSLGHDLSWGTSVFSRTISSSRATQIASGTDDSAATSDATWSTTAPPNDDSSDDDSSDDTMMIPAEELALPVPF